MNRGKKIFGRIAFFFLAYACSSLANANLLALYCSHAIFNQETTPREFKGVSYRHFSGLEKTNISGDLLLGKGQHLFGIYGNADEISIYPTLLVDLKNNIVSSLYDVAPQLRSDWGFLSFTNKVSRPYQPNIFTLDPNGQWAVFGLCAGGPLLGTRKLIYVDFVTKQTKDLHPEGNFIDVTSSAVSENGRYFSALVKTEPLETPPNAQGFELFVWDFSKDFVPARYRFRVPQIQAAGGRNIHLAALLGDASKVFFNVWAGASDAQQAVSILRMSPGSRVKPSEGLSTISLSQREQGLVYEMETVPGHFLAMSDDGTLLVTFNYRTLVAWKVGKRKSVVLQVPKLQEVIESLKLKTAHPLDPTDRLLMGDVIPVKASIAQALTGNIWLAATFEFSVRDPGNPMYAHKEFAVVRWNLSKRASPTNPEIYFSSNFGKVQKMTFHMTSEGKLLLLALSGKDLVIASDDKNVTPFRIPLFEEAHTFPNIHVSKSGQQIAIESPEGVHVFDFTEIHN